MSKGFSDLTKSVPVLGSITEKISNFLGSPKTVENNKSNVSVMPLAKMIQKDPYKEFLDSLNNKPSGLDGDKITKAEQARLQKLIEQSKSGYTELTDLFRSQQKTKLEIFDEEAKKELDNLRKHHLSTYKVEQSQYKLRQELASVELFKLSTLVNKTLSVENLKDSIKRMVDAQVERLNIVKNALDNSLQNFRQNRERNMSYSQAVGYVFGGELDALEAQGKTYVDKLSALKEQLSSAFSDFRLNAISGFAEIGAGFITGANSFSDSIAMVGVTISNIIGDLLIKIGTTMVSVGGVMVGLQKAIASLMENPVASIIVGGLAIATGYALKSIASKTSSAISASASAQIGNSAKSSTQSSGMTSGASYQYGGASYATQTIKLAIDLTGAITASPTGYNINKSLETVLRVTGR